MNPDVLILAVCHPEKIKFLSSVCKNFDSLAHKFNNKILAIDEFNGYKFSNDLYQELLKEEWMIIVDNHKSRSLSMLNGINLSDSDWIFYSEDDIKVNLPESFDFEYINCKHNNRQLGFVSLTFGGTKHDLNTGNLGDLQFAEENIILQTSELVMFERIDEMRDSYFCEFPGMFIRKDLLQNLIMYARNNYPNQQIEIALSSAWFALGYNKDYYKASILKTEFLDFKSTEPMRIITDSRFIQCLDPNQGQFLHGGSQLI